MLGPSEQKCKRRGGPHRDVDTSRLSVLRTRYPAPQTAYGAPWRPRLIGAASILAQTR